MDDCSDRIGRLEDEDGLFYNAIPAEIEARAEELNDPQVRVWGLLSIARLWGAGPTGMGGGSDVLLPPDLTLSRGLSAPDGYVQRSL